MIEVDGRHKRDVIILGLIGLAVSVLTYTVTVTLSYSSVVRDIAVIRTVVDERTAYQKTELTRLQGEISAARVEIAALRVTIDNLRGELFTERAKRTQ